MYTWEYTAVHKYWVWCVCVCIYLFIYSAIFVKKPYKLAWMTQAWFSSVRFGGRWRPSPCKRVSLYCAGSRRPQLNAQQQRGGVEEGDEGSPATIGSDQGKLTCVVHPSVFFVYLFALVAELPLLCKDSQRGNRLTDRRTDRQVRQGLCSLYREPTGITGVVSDEKKKNMLTLISPPGSLRGGGWELPLTRAPPIATPHKLCS